MPIHWATTTRPRTVDRLLAQLAPTAGDPGSGGIALLGPDGIGKTTLAEQLGDRLGDKDPVWVIGTASNRAVPFGAFSRLINIAEVGKPAALIQAALDSLLTVADGALIIVDDAHLLDALSASLVYQLAQHGAGRQVQSGADRLVVTVASTATPPDPITALWDDDLLTKIDVAPLDSDETAAILATVGVPGAATELHHRSGGNPLYLRHLVQAAPDPDGDQSLPELIDRFLAQQPAQIREVLSYLTVHEPISIADLTAITSEAAVAEAERAGVIEVFGEDGYAGHPRYLERSEAIIEPAVARRLRTTVAAQLATHPQRHVVDLLERAILLLESDTPLDPDLTTAAAQQALRLGDLPLCERLAGAVLNKGERFDARMALAQALAWQGRGREAGFALAAVDPATLSEEQIMTWAVPRAANQFFMLSEPERAMAFLQNTQRRVSSPAARITLDALSATFAMNAGNLTRAIEIATEVLASPHAPDMAVAWAASAAALCSARMGRFDQVESMVHRASSSEHPGLLRFTVGLAETTTLLMSGQADDAYDATRRFTDFAELAQPGRAIGELLLAQVLIARGDQAAAAELLIPAAATLELTGYSWGPLSLMYLAVALAQQGLVAEASKTMSRAESRHGTKSALFAPELGVARAWRLAAMGDAHGAIAAAREAARMAERGGQNAIAVFAWHEAVRLGDTRAAAELVRFTELVPCGFTRIALAHANALAAGDSAGLAAAATQLAEAGFDGAAATAAEQAQRLSGEVK
jgi:hypothetical protein